MCHELKVGVWYASQARQTDRQNSFRKRENRFIIESRHHTHITECRQSAITQMSNLSMGIAKFVRHQAHATPQGTKDKVSSLAIVDMQRH